MCTQLPGCVCDAEIPRETAICLLCADDDSPGFYRGCMIKDGYESDWNCDGKGNLWRYVETAQKTEQGEPK